VSKLALISYGLIILGAITLAFDVKDYWVSLQPMGCYGCAPTEYSLPNVSTFFEIVFMAGAGLTKLLDHEQKKVSARMTPSS